MRPTAWPNASVVIVGYNSRDDLDGCLGTLERVEYPAEIEVILVDNASLDDSIKHVREQFPWVRIIENATNAGYAGGNNRGATEARGDILVFLNPDTLVEAEWLRWLIRPLLDDPTIGLTTSKIVLMDQPERINACGNDVSLSGIATCRHAFRPSDEIVANEEVPAVSGASFAIRSDLFHRLGGFDETFFMYVEDTDLSWRARLAGYRCLLAANSVVAHRHEQRLTAEKIYFIERNRYLMLLKNLKGSSLLALLPTLIVTEAAVWNWIVLRGRSHVRAKLAASVWLLRNTASIRKHRRHTQQLRRTADRIILRRHHIVPPATAAVMGLPGRIARTAIAPIAIVAAMPALLMLRLLPVPISILSDGIGMVGLMS